MQGEHADEQAADYPHGPGPPAHSGRAVLADQVDHLGKVGKNRDRDPGYAENLEHARSTPFPGAKDGNGKFPADDQLGVARRSRFSTMPESRNPNDLTNESTPPRSRFATTSS